MENTLMIFIFKSEQMQTNASNLIDTTYDFRFLEDHFAISVRLSSKSASDLNLERIKKIMLISDNNWPIIHINNLSYSV